MRRCRSAKTPTGETVYQMPVDVDETTLQQIAQMTGGKYYRADNAETVPANLRGNRQAGKNGGGRQQIHGVQGIVSMVGGRAGWCCCWSKWCWAKPCFGDCHEIYDLRFTIYDLKMRFENPHLLWLLLVLPPALALFFWWASRRRQQLLAQFIRGAVAVGADGRRFHRRAGKSGSRCLILAVALLIVALARPQYGFDLQEVEQRGLDIVVAIDTSKSMLAEDIAPNRLERAKLAALDLMQQAKPDRLGLVAFAGDAFLECPLTIDDTAFQQSVQALEREHHSRKAARPSRRPSRPR